MNLYVQVPCRATKMGLFKNLKKMIMTSKIDYKDLISKGALIVDVRSPGGFQSGNANGSINIPLQDLPSKINDLKGKEVILVCRSGARAGNALAYLTNEGVTAHNAGPWQTISNL